MARLNAGKLVTIKVYADDAKDIRFLAKFAHISIAKVVREQNVFYKRLAWKNTLGVGIDANNKEKRSRPRLS